MKRAPLCATYTHTLITVISAEIILFLLWLRMTAFIRDKENKSAPTPPSQPPARSSLLTLDRSNN